MTEFDPFAAYGAQITLEQERDAMKVAGVAAKLVEKEEGPGKVYLVFPVVFCVRFALVKTRCWVLISVRTVAAVVGPLALKLPGIE